MSKNVLPVFSSKSFIVSSLKLRPLIHFKFMFVYGVRESSDFILLHVAVQFSQQQLLNKLVFCPGEMYEANTAGLDLFLQAGMKNAGIKTIPMEKKCEKAKWLSEEALQTAVKRREAKGKGEKERYTHLNAEFQRIARRDEKAFLSDQYKETGKQQNGKD